LVIWRSFLDDLSTEAYCRAQTWRRRKITDKKTLKLVSYFLPRPLYGVYNTTTDTMDSTLYTSPDEVARFATDNATTVGFNKAPFEDLKN